MAAAINDLWPRRPWRSRSRPGRLRVTISEPETNEGRKELSARAKEAEERRDLELAKYHHYEDFFLAAFQIGIVLASAAVITGAVALVWLAGVLASLGSRFLALGLFAPHIAHHFL